MTPIVSHVSLNRVGARTGSATGSRPAPSRSFASLRTVLAAGAAAALVLAGGCANRTDPAIINTPSYQAGYADGCTTGNELRDGFKSTVTRNQTLFDTDEPYRVGWRQGYSSCGERQERRRGRDDFLSEDRFDQGPI